MTETLLHCPNRRSAEGVLASRQLEVFEGRYKPRGGKPVLLEEFVEKFLAAKKGELASWMSYRGSLRLHVVPYFKGKYMTEITAGDCEDYRRHRLEQGAKPATVRNELRYLQSVYADARKRELVTTDPVGNVSFKGIRNTPDRAPTPAEILRLVEAATEEPPESFLRPLFFVMLCTGLRLASALRLRWDHVNYVEGCLGTIQKGGTWVWPPMSQRLREELLRWQPISEGLDKGGWVFPSLRTGQHLTTSAVHKAWPSLLERAEVDGITRHDLRRFMVTRLRELAADDRAIGLVTGHRTSAVIDRYDKRGLAIAADFAEQATDMKSISDAAKRQDEAKARKTKLQ
jgi:integrase